MGEKLMAFAAIFFTAICSRQLCRANSRLSDCVTGHGRIMQQRLEIDACYGADWADTVHCHPGIRHNADFSADGIGDNGSDTGIHGGFWLLDAA